MPKRPRLGDDVHFRLAPATPGSMIDVVPAKVVRLWHEDEDGLTVSVLCLLEHGTLGRPGVRFGDIDTPNTWFWPPSAPPDGEFVRAVAQAAAGFQQPPEAVPVDAPAPPPPELPPAEAEPTFRPDPIVQPETTPETEPAPAARRRKGDAA